MKYFKITPSVIWAKNCGRDFDQYVAFRREFTFENDGEVNLCLFANTYYNLYLSDNKFDYVENIKNSFEKYIGNYDVVRILTQQLYINGEKK